MKRSSAYTVILLVLVLIIALLGFLILRRQAPRDQVEPSPSPSGQIQPPVPETGTPEPTPSPSESPEPTEEPVFETRPPVETDPPEETPEPTEPPIPEASGSIASSTGTGLNIRADWYTLPGGQTLQVDVYCLSYSLTTAAQWQSVQLQVGGQSYAADSRAISYDGSDLVTSPLASFTVETPPSGSSITVTWNYKGSYSGTELNEITATGSISY